MSQQSHSVQFDMQTNTFYKIDKQTGQMVKSYKNGDKLPIFKPSVTGFQYKERKNNKNHQRHYSYKARNSLRSQKSKQQLAISNSIYSKDKYKTISLYSQNAKTMSSKKQSILALTASPKTKTSFWDNRTINFDSVYSSRLKQTHNLKGRSSAFQQSAHKFQQISQSKLMINHSPNKSLQGSVQKKNRTQTLCVTRSNFRDEDTPELGYRKPQKRQVPNIQRKLILEGKYDQKQQIKKDKLFAYRRKYRLRLVNPALIPHQNKKSIEKQKDRRINLLKLQKMVINHNNKTTKKIIQNNF